MENAEPLKATIRNGADLGKSGARRLRRTGQIPAVCYGGKADSLSVAVDPGEVVTRLTGTFGKNAIFKLDMDDGSSQVVRVSDYQRDPVLRTIIHVDFAIIDPNKVLETFVPLVLEGRPAGVAAGGKLRQIRRDLKIRATAGKIPASLSLDVSPLNNGDVIRVSEVIAPEGVKLSYDQNFAVASVSKPREEEAVEEEEVEAE
jgi:large subunit ribosomal protein L25